MEGREVATLLETTVASVTSALQRARSTLKAVDVMPGEPFRPSDPAQRELLTRYCAAFERHDITALVALLHEDATMSMPPSPGGFAVATGSGRRCWIRTRPVRARASSRSRRTARGVLADQTRSGRGPRPFGLVFLDVFEGLVRGITTYLDADRLIPLFGAPADSPGHRTRFPHTDEFRDATAYHRGRQFERTGGAGMTTVQPIITTSDLDRLRAFYERLLGAVEASRFPEDGPAFFVGLKLGDSEVGLVHEATTDLSAPQRILLSVRVDDVDGLLGLVEAVGGAARPVDRHAVGRTRGPHPRP
ncbi:VOC family protein [Streptosporangium lutulentum]